MQFLIEAALLAAVGGILGLLGGAVLTAVLARIFEITLRITAGYVVLALVVSSAVGIVSGFYPAMRAARLDPIVALAERVIPCRSRTAKTSGWRLPPCGRIASARC